MKVLQRSASFLQSVLPPGMKRGVVVAFLVSVGPPCNSLMPAQASAAPNGHPPARTNRTLESTTFSIHCDFALLTSLRSFLRAALSLARACLRFLELARQSSARVSALSRCRGVLPSIKLQLAMARGIKPASRVLLSYSWQSTSILFVAVALSCRGAFILIKIFSVWRCHRSFCSVGCGSHELKLFLFTIETLFVRSRTLCVTKSLVPALRVCVMIMCLFLSPRCRCSPCALFFRVTHCWCGAVQSLCFLVRGLGCPCVCAVFSLIVSGLSCFT